MNVNVLIVQEVLGGLGKSSWGLGLGLGFEPSSRHRDYVTAHMSEIVTQDSNSKVSKVALSFELVV